MGSPARMHGVSAFRMCLAVQANLANVLSHVTVALFIAALFIFSAIQFDLLYSFDSKIPEENLVLVYQVDRQYPNLNENCVLSEKLEIPPSNFDSMIGFGDLPMLAEGFVDKLEAIYVVDESKRNALYNAMEEAYLAGGTQAENPTVIASSIPLSVYDNFRFMIPVYDIFWLRAGRAPSDGVKEIAASEDMLSIVFGLGKREDIENYLGLDLDFGGERHTIVGVTAFELAWTSYKPGSDSFFYLYDTSDYDMFAQEQVQFLSSINFYPDCLPDSVFVTRPGLEREVLNDPMLAYPAENYYSHHCLLGWTGHYNGAFVQRQFLINLAAVLLVGLFVAATRRSSIRNELRLLEDCSNYNGPRNLDTKKLVS